eukprot:944796-Pleurochrysis_carterae.AAC.7
MEDERTERAVEKEGRGMVGVEEKEATKGERRYMHYRAPTICENLWEVIVPRFATRRPSNLGELGQSIIYVFRADTL